MRHRKWTLILQENAVSVMLVCAATFFLITYFILLSLIFLIGCVIILFLLLLLSPRPFKEITAQEYEMEHNIISVLRMAKFRPYPLSFGWMQYQDLEMQVNNNLGAHFNSGVFVHVLHSLIGQSIIVCDSVLHRYVGNDDAKRGLFHAYRLSDSYESRRPRDLVRKKIQMATQSPVAENC